MQIRTDQFIYAFALGASSCGMAFAQEAAGPAVKSINGKISLGYTHANDANQGSGGFAVGSLAFPITHSFGAQVDIGANGLDTSAGQLNDTRGAGLHLFTRDPSKYLIGVYGHILDVDTVAGKIRNTRVGIEGEYYLDDYTIRGFIGEDRVSGIGPKTDFDSIDFSVSRFFGDNMQVSLGAERSFGSTDGSIGIEYLTSVSGTQVSLFGDASFGDSGTQLTVGTSIYFGSGGMSLKDVHRRNDPPSRLSSAAGSGYFQALASGGLVKVLTQKPT